MKKTLERKGAKIIFKFGNYTEKCLLRPLKVKDYTCIIRKRASTIDLVAHFVSGLL